MFLHTTFEETIFKFRSLYDRSSLKSFLIYERRMIVVLLSLKNIEGEPKVVPFEITNLFKSL